MQANFIGKLNQSNEQYMALRNIRQNVKQQIRPCEIKTYIDDSQYGLNSIKFNKFDTSRAAQFRLFSNTSMHSSPR